MNIYTEATSGANWAFSVLAKAVAIKQIKTLMMTTSKLISFSGRDLGLFTKYTVYLSRSDQKTLLVYYRRKTRRNILKTKLHIATHPAIDTY